MKTTILLSLAFSIFATSCGKKDIIEEPASMGIVDSFANKRIIEPNKINEENCIDEAMKRDLSEQELVKKVLAESDISYCNGVRVRVKIFKLSTEEIRVYGFAQSSSGKLSCLRNGKDLKRIPFFGYQGTLNGNGIKVSLGGHQYTTEGKLITSDKLSGKYVKFDVATYSGEMGFFENDTLRCWAIH